MAATKSNPYSFRKGRAIGGLTANQVHTELERVRKRDGSITAPAVVEAAKPAKSVLHPAFEWSDAVAAALYRLNQARNLITSVLVRTTPTEEPRRVFVHVTPPHASTRTAGNYQKQEDVAADPSLAASYIAELNSAISEAERSLREFERLVGEQGDEQLAIVALVAQALATARAGVERLH